MDPDGQTTPAGYKQTAIGVIPTDWEVKSLENLFTISAGRDLVKNAYSQIRDADHAFPIYSNSLENAGLYGYTKMPRHEEDSVTITARGTIGRANARDHKFDAIGRLLVLEPKTSLDCFFISEYLNNRVAFSIESTGVPQLTAPQASKYLVVCPKPKEQYAIASALSDTDELIAKLEALIEKKKCIKQGTMQELLAGKSRLPGFSKAWITRTMAEHATLKARIGWQGLTTAEYLDSGDYYLVTGTDFIGGRVRWETCHFVDKSRYTQDKNIQLAEGDILLTKDGTIGKVGFIDCLPGSATLNSGVFVIRPNSKAFYPLFLYYILTSLVFEKFLAKLEAGSTIVHLYQKDFVSFCFLAPELDEQIEIATALSDMDAEIAKLESQLAKYKNLKEGMMQVLLTGKIRLF